MPQRSTLPLLGLIFLLGWCTLGLRGQAADNREVLSGPPPEWVEQLTLPVLPKAPDTSVGWHYLLVESQTHAELKTSFQRNAYQIVSDGGLRYGSQVNISFDPSYETLTFHHIRLIRDGQVTDKFDRKRLQVIQQEQDMQRLLYNGELSALLILEDVRVGDIIDYAYSKTGRNPVFGNHFLDSYTLGWGVPVSHLRHRLIHAPLHLVLARRAGESPCTQDTKETAWGRERIWEGRNLPAVVYDSNTPDWHEPYAYVQVTDFPDWKSVIDWALPLYTPDGPVSPELKQKAAELAAAARTPEERILAALKFVQEQVRYLGIEMGANSHRPSPPGDVLARRFGDCKDKAYLLCSLLQQMGVRAAPMLVHSDREHTLSRWLPSPYAFDHVIVMAWIDKVGYQLDPTLLYQRGSLGHRHTTRYGPGLVIERSFRDLLTMAPSPNDISVTTLEERFNVTGLDTPTDLVITTTYSGRTANSMRAQLAGSTREEISKSYLDFYARYYPEISSTQPLTWRDTEATNTVVVEEHYRINSLFARTEGSKTLKAEFHPTLLNEYTDRVGAPGRTAPLRLAHPVDLTHRTIVNLHEDWPVNPEHSEVVDAGFKFERRIAGIPRRLEFTYRWRSLADHIKPADFGAHVKNLTRVNDAVGYQLTYNEAVAGEADFDLNWAMIALSVLTFTVGTAAGLLILLRRPSEPPVIPAEPASAATVRLTGIGGWLLVVAFGLVVRPIMLVHTLGSGADTYYNLDTWRSATNPASSGYLPHYAVIAPVELTVNSVLLLVSVLLLILFFLRRRIFPPIMIGFMVLLIGSTIFDTWAQSALNATAADQAAAGKAVVQSIVFALIWIPYFCISRRVKLTFTR